MTLRFDCCSCQKGFTGPICEEAANAQTAVTAVSKPVSAEQRLLISLSTLLPVAALIVFVAAAIYVCGRMRTPPEVGAGNSNVQQSFTNR